MIELETPRLLLRQQTLDDVDALMGIFSDPQAMRYYPGTKDRSEAIAWVQRNLDGYPQGVGLLGAVLRETGVLVGQCGLVHQEIHGRRETEIGYLFLRKYWGLGLATEAACACRDYAFETLGRSTVVSLIDPRNTPSRRVAERVGMVLDEMIDKWDKRVCVYRLDRAPPRG